MTGNLHTPRCQDHALSLPRLYLSVSDTEGDQDGASFEVTSTQKQVNVGYYNTYLVIQSDLFGMVKWPL